jgi:hypothetical protein
VVSGSKQKAERTAADVQSVEHGITYDDFHEGVAADVYNAVYICSPSALHLPYAETAAELGKAVLCEKTLEAINFRSYPPYLVVVPLEEDAQAIETGQSRRYGWLGRVLDIRMIVNIVHRISTDEWYRLVSAISDHILSNRILIPQI